MGVPDETLGRAIRAFVGLDERASLTEHRVKWECMQRLESFMVPRDEVVVRELPMTAIARVLRRFLPELPPGPPEKRRSGSTPMQRRIETPVGHSVAQLTRSV